MSRETQILSALSEALDGFDRLVDEPANTREEFAAAIEACKRLVEERVVRAGGELPPSARRGRFERPDSLSFDPHA